MFNFGITLFLIFVGASTALLICYAQGEEWLNVFRAVIQWVALCFGGFALTIGWLNYHRKSGSKFRAYFTLQEFQNSLKKDVVAVWLTNDKDKTEVIYGLYLKSGKKYISLLWQEDDPIIIPAYSTIKIDLLDDKEIHIVTYQDFEKSEVTIGDELRITNKLDIYVNNASDGLIKAKKVDRLRSIEAIDVIGARPYPVGDLEFLNFLMEDDLKRREPEHEKSAIRALALNTRLEVIAKHAEKKTQLLKSEYMND